MKNRNVNGTMELCIKNSAKMVPPQALVPFSKPSAILSRRSPPIKKNGAKMVQPYNLAPFSLKLPSFCFETPRSHEIHILGLLSSHH